MKLIFKKEQFAKAIKTKRVIELNIDLRTLSAELGISASTLSRCENGYTCDVDVFATICKWLNAEMSSFFQSEKLTKRKSSKK